jgi:hypothetical protein
LSDARTAPVDRVPPLRQRERLAEPDGSSVREKNWCQFFLDTNCFPNGEALERWLGVYFVDRYAADTGGGVYFRAHAAADGIGPDTMSYGFAFRPNPEGTPFGGAGYRYTHVADDWYVFSASNDF